MRDVEYLANTEPEPQKEKQFNLRGLFGAPGIGRSERGGVKKTVERVSISQNHVVRCHQGTCADGGSVVNLSNHLLQLFWDTSYDAVPSHLKHLAVWTVGMGRSSYR